MKITAYKVGKSQLELMPALRERRWMDETPDSYAYRCLPMQISNTLGYWFYNKEDLIVSWTGGQHQRDLTIHTADGKADYFSSAFGSGILTFHTGYVIRTEKEWDMMVMGPTNMWFDFMVPLSGVVETSWLPFTFTMNWKILRPGTYTIPKDVPICQMFPIPHSYEGIKAHVTTIDTDKELEHTYNEWSKSRKKIINALDKVFNKGEPDQGGVIRSEPKTHWEKNYYAGREPVSGKRIPDHNIKRKFPEFE